MRDLKTPLTKPATYVKVAAAISVIVVVIAVIDAFSGHTRRASPVPIPANGALWGITRSPGANLGGSRLNAREQVVEDAERKLGRKFDYDRQFYRWGDNPFAANPTPNGYLKWSSTVGGHIMDINLVAADRQGGFTRWADIADGSQDGYLDTLAVDIKAWGKPAFFTFQHEPESLICPNDVPCAPATGYYGTTTDYKAAWQHLVEVFRAKGVKNLAYVWQTGSYRWKSPSDYRYGPKNYPGAGVIDWIAVDPFNSGVPRWQSFRALIQPWYDWASAQDKPLMIGAFGSVEKPGDPGARAAWFTRAATDLKQRFPKVKALMYFDNNPSRTPKDDWRLVDTNSASFAAYKAWGLESYFNTRDCNVSSCRGLTPTTPPHTT